jgi:hypothetical protein
MAAVAVNYRELPVTMYQMLQRILAMLRRLRDTNKFDELRQFKFLTRYFLLNFVSFDEMVNPRFELVVYQCVAHFNAPLLFHSSNYFISEQVLQIMTNFVYETVKIWHSSANEGDRFSGGFRCNPIIMNGFFGNGNRDYFSLYRWLTNLDYLNPSEHLIRNLQRKLGNILIKITNINFENFTFRMEFCITDHLVPVPIHIKKLFIETNLFEFDLKKLLGRAYPEKVAVQDTLDDMIPTDNLQIKKLRQQMLDPKEFENLPFTESPDEQDIDDIDELVIELICRFFFKILPHPNDMKKISLFVKLKQQDEEVQEDKENFEFEKEERNLVRERMIIFRAD